MMRGEVNQRIYGRREDAESINRALMVNGLVLHRYRYRTLDQLAA
jgi:hypothetical protein